MSFYPKKPRFKRTLRPLRPLRPLKPITPIGSAPKPVAPLPPQKPVRHYSSYAGNVGDMTAVDLTKPIEDPAKQQAEKQKQQDAADQAKQEKKAQISQEIQPTDTSEMEQGESGDPQSGEETGESGSESSSQGEGNTKSQGQPSEKPPQPKSQEQQPTSNSQPEAASEKEEEPSLDQSNPREAGGDTDTGSSEQESTPDTQDSESGEDSDEDADSDEDSDDKDSDDEDSDDEDSADEKSESPGGGTDVQPGEQPQDATPPEIQISELRTPGEESEMVSDDEEIEPADPNDAREMRADPIDTDDLRKVVEKAIEDIKNGRGTGISPLTNLLAKQFITKTNWTTILRRFLTKGSPTTYEDRSYRRPNRSSHVLNRYIPSDVTMEGGNPRKTIVVAIDTSGSVYNPRFLDRFFSEVYRIIKTQNMDVLMVLWHSTAYYSVLLNPKNVKQELAKAHLASGGTNMSSVAQLLMDPKFTKIRKKLAGIVYITDLEVEHQPVFVKGVPIAIFGPEQLMPQEAIERFRKAGITIATYTDTE